jgi:hypothetical protein
LRAELVEALGLHKSHGIPWWSAASWSVLWLVALCDLAIYLVNAFRWVIGATTSHASCHHERRTDEVLAGDEQ